MQILKFKFSTPTIYLMGILTILMSGVLFSAQSNINLGEGRNYDEKNQPVASSEYVFGNYAMDEIDYNWYDAYNNGSNIWLNGDDTSHALNLPFIFDFYDESFDTVYISSNGWMSFTDTSPTSFSDVPFPSTSPEYAIAVFWDDLNAQDNIYVWETTNFVVIEYHDYYHLSGDLTGT
ncbi:MAG: hypothetical protein ACTSRK_11205, partial [Promethearchaeota archaeon]